MYLAFTSNYYIACIAMILVHKSRPVRFYVFQFRFDFDTIKFKTSIFDSVFDFQNIFDSIIDSIFNTPVSFYHIYIQGLQACTSIMQVTYNLQDCNM